MMKLNRTGVLAAMLFVASLAPMALAQTPVKLRFQSAYPASGLAYENSKFLVARIRALSGGKLQIDMFPPGAVVPAFEVLDAVHKQVVDGAHSSSAYWLGKNRASGLFSPTPGGPLGMDMIDYLGWIYDGGGLALYAEIYQKEMKRNVVVLPLTSMAYQPLGWFKTPVKNWDDLKGRKCRLTSFTAEVFGRAGVKPVNLPGGEIVPAGQRGVIDCAEFIGPAEDMRIGFHTVWKHLYMPSIHEYTPVAELLVNADVWNKLAPEYREIIKTATLEATFRSQMINNKLNAEAIVELQQKHGVTIHPTPPDILAKILETWDEIAKEEYAKNPFFKKVYDSQRAYASKVVPARRAVQAPYEIGADYYWPQKK
jgi:TRAP-type mannitol/chloroaromatic compound transport system substrate-binding protein